MQTNRHDAAITLSLDKKLLSIFRLSGHQIPDTPRHYDAPITSNIGRPLHFASASPLCNVPYHAMRGGTTSSPTVTDEKIATTTASVDLIGWSLICHDSLYKELKNQYERPLVTPIFELFLGQ